jgi:hypothetical protein
MQLRQRVFATQRREGRTAAELAGSGDLGPTLRVSKIKGRYTQEWRLQAHLVRHFGASGALLSYENARKLPTTILRLYFENFDESDLPPAQSRSVASLHDQRFDYVRVTAV